MGEQTDVRQIEVDAETVELVLVRVAAEGPETDYPVPLPPAIELGAPARRPVFFTGVAGWREI